MQFGLLVSRSLADLIDVFFMAMLHGTLDLHQRASNCFIACLILHTPPQTVMMLPPRFDDAWQVCYHYYQAIHAWQLSRGCVAGRLLCSSRSCVMWPHCESIVMCVGSCGGCCLFVLLFVEQHGVRSSCVFVRLELLCKVAHVPSW